MKFVDSRDGIIERGAIIGGRTANGENLYIGKVQHENTLEIGKIHPSHKCMYIPYYGKEIKFTNYKILVAT
jgi:hypothetical protein